MFIEETRLRRHLDAAIFAVNPLERWPAHVTLAGPFERRVEVPRNMDFQQQIYVFGPGRFDNAGHHTVFLHVGSRDLASRIDKPDFKNAIPHLSLYNGKDKRTADLLFERLQGIRAYGSFNSTKLVVVEASQRTFDFELYVDPKVLDRTKTLTLDQLKRLDLKQRVDIAVDAIKQGFERPLPLGVKFV